MAQRYRKITVDGRTVALHRYVYEQARGPVPEGMIVHHINGDRFDNRLENLALMTHEQHSRHHNDRHPRTKTCEACGVEYEPAPTKRARSKSCSYDCARELMRRAAVGRGKITSDDARVIRQRVAAGEQQKALGAEFGLSPAAMSALVHRRTWRHVA